MEEARKNTAEVVLTGMLGEFREALRDEIAAIEKSGRSSTLLRAGKHIESGESEFWYRFQVDYLPNIPADTPCNLIVGKTQYSVAVIRFDESEIVVSSREELPDTLAAARLENGATVLMERLIKRIEDNAEKPNPAGSRMIPAEGKASDSFRVIEPNAAFAQDPYKNEQQNRAILAALQNDITYIWGPPGTGKTTVIGSIIEQLYQAKRSVLVVSHTNTAVDGAIKKVQNLRRSDESCPVLRLGSPHAELDPAVYLECHTARLGEKLFKRQAELKSIQTEKNKRLSNISNILQKLNWLRSSKVVQLEAETAVYLELACLRNTAEADYEQASSQLRQHKADNPELKQLSALKKRKQSYEEKRTCLSHEIAIAEAHLSESAESLRLAEEELAKHHVYKALNEQLEKTMPTSFLQGKIVQQDEAISSLRCEKEALESKKANLEQTISQGKKNALSAFFSRKAIQQAEAALPEAHTKLDELAFQIESLQNTKAEYETQLIQRKSLEQRLADVEPRQSAENWEEAKKAALSQRSIAEKSKTALSAELEQAVSEIQKVESRIVLLQPIMNELFRYVALSAECKKKMQEAEEKLGIQRDHCLEIIEEEVSACGALICTSQSDPIEKTIAAIRDCYNQVSSELDSVDGEAMAAEAETLRKELTEIHSELLELADKIKDLEHQAILQADIVGATLTKAYLSDFIQERKFDTVILDEASMAPIPALWCTSYLTGRNIIIVGDFLQLPPIVMADTPAAKKWLGRDIFAVSGMQERAKKGKKPPENFIMLTSQYRMEKEIADIANLYYGQYHALQSHDSDPKRVRERALFYQWFPEKGEHRVELLDTSGLHTWVTSVPQGKGHSRLNCFSAALDVEIAFSWLEAFLSSSEEKLPLSDPKILIVAPYKPHIDRINKLIAFEYKQRGLPEDANLIKAGTIHSFQGNEADIVIFDLVLDEPHWRANLFMSGQEMTDEMNKLFNVAVTRAKYKLVVVGNIKYCRQRAKNNSLSMLLDYLIDQKHFPITDAKTAYPKLLITKSQEYTGNGGIDSKHLICQGDVFFDYFINDLKCFQRRLIIYSPFMTPNRISVLIPFFHDATVLGKRVIVVTKAIEDRGQREESQIRKLEAALKDSGVEVLHKKGMHEQLIFVDDSAVWLGSLNVLSFSGETGEIMHRLFDRELTDEYEKIYDIPSIDSAVKNQVEQKCPICCDEMQLCEGNTGIYWKCRNGDYSRSVEQQYPYDGVLRCKCGGEYGFVMKNQPRWVCRNDPKHYQIIRFGDLKLPQMAARIPTKKERKAVEAYFAQYQKAEINIPSAKEPSEGKKKTPARKAAPKANTQDIQMTLFDMEDGTS